MLINCKAYHPITNICSNSSNSYGLLASELIQLILRNKTLEVGETSLKFQGCLNQEENFKMGLIRIFEILSFLKHLILLIILV